MSNWLADRGTDFSSFVDLLSWRADRQPDQQGYTFLLDGETEAARLTYAELDRQARAIGALLQSAGAAGARALLLYPPGLDYVAAFFGCLYAGFVAVPAYPPDPARLDRTLPRLQAIVADAQPAVVLTTSPILSMAEALSAQDATFQSMRWLATDALAAGLTEEWRSPAINSATLAFLQYTSGSTAAPKGVMLTHGNLLYNSTLIQRCFEHTPASQGVIWLPPYHDMGLIGGVLQPLYAGFPVVLMSPVAFLQRPLRWLQAVSHYRATTSGGPNFAYDLCVRKITPEQRATLDLSAWHVAFNGAEPIRPDTLDRFATTFGSCGFRREAFYPCYGLAEATLIVSGGRAADPPVVRLFQEAAPGRDPAVAEAAHREDDRLLAGSGRALIGQQIAVVDPQSLTGCEPGQVGEIWVSGPSVAQGYWRQPEETERSFQAFSSDSREGPFLRTGDLGFMQDGELFVTGRLKDLIIIRGRNHYPQDIELTVERSHRVLRPGCGAAFSIDVGGDERLVVVQEVERQSRSVNVDEVAAAVRREVAQRHELQAYAVVLIKPGSIPKTSSGKIQRYACRAAFLTESLELLGRSILEEREPAPSARELTRETLMAQPPESRQQLLEAYLQEQAARLLRVEPSLVDPRQPVSAMGLDSLMAVELQHTIETDLDVVMPMVSFLQEQSIALLAAEILRRLSAIPGAPEPALAPAKDAFVEYPLSFAQQRMWLLNQFEPDNPAYIIPAAARLRGRLDLYAWTRSLDEIVRRHATLRTSFGVRDGRPVQLIAPALTLRVPLLDLRGLAALEQEAAVQRLMTAEVRRPFNLARGSLLRMSLLRLDAEEHLLLLTMHHIISDGWSLNVFVEELAALYRAYLAGASSPLPQLPVQYADYAVWQREWLQGSGVGGQRDKETRRHGDTETRSNSPQHPTPNTQHPIPNTQHPSPITHHPTPIQAQLAYWKQQLAGAPPLLDLPTDRTRAALRTFRGATQTFALAKGLSEALREMSRREAVTPFMLLLAAFTVLLHRYTGQEDIVLGTPISGRTRVAIEGLIGFFVNMLVLRTDLAERPSFRELLRRVREVCLGAYAHQDLPFEKLVEELQPGRDLGRTPLFQVVFAMQNTSPQRLELPGLSVSLMPLQSETAKFDLTLFMHDAEQGLIGTLEYDADLFDASTITRLAGHLQTLLEGIVATPDLHVPDLPLLTPAEQHQLVVEWNASSADYPRDVCVYRLFAGQATRIPDAVALVFQRPPTNDQRPTTNDQRPLLHPLTPSPLHPFTSQHLTYRELNQRANQLAHHLRELGVGPDVLVGICMERGLEMIVGILGILKAGGAYVPLDPSYPTERLTFMLEDAHVVVLLTIGETDKETRRQRDKALEEPRTKNQEPRTKNQELRVTLSPSHPFTLSPPHPLTPSPPQPLTPSRRAVVDLHADWPTIAAAPSSDSPCPAGPEQLAYVIYTSGSTGRPKGVMVKQRGLINLCFGLRAFFDDATVSTTGLITSISFDISVNQIFPTLLFGRALHIIPDPVKYDSRAMAQYLDRNRVDLLDSVPSYLNAMLTEMHPERLANTLKYILVGGEKLEQRLLQKVFAQLGERVMIVNIYGLTEITDINSFSVITSRDLDKTLTIGRPLNNNQIYITDRYNNLQPVGVTGELCIAGESLSRGYLNRPELTADRFIPNPFAGVLGDGCWVLEDSAPNTQHPTPNTRLYRTGDLGRRLADGTIELFGRIDHQVKVHGFRIEVGEIEALLDRHPAVRENVVVVREDAPGERRLVAYVVPKIEDRGLKIEDSGSSAPDPLSSILYPLSSELRDFLKEKLPAYMVPAAFVVLEGLPHTPNGKIDRKALPVPDRYRTGMEGALVAPRTPAEELLAGIWADVLHVERVGIHDSFFELGGHSLLATQIVSRVQAAFGVELSLRSLFETPTVAGLAERVATMRPAAPELLAPRRRSIPSAALPLSFAQQRLWLLDQFEPDNPAYIIPAAARLRGRLDLDAWTRSLNEIVRRHAALRTSFGVRDGQPVQLIAPALTLRVPLLDLRRLAEAEQAAAVERLTAAEAQRSFDLARGPLLRVRLLRLDAEEHLLLLTMHHIISDGWSLNVFVEELAALYRAYLAGASSPLPELPIQYADFALWQREWLQGPGRQGDKETRRQGDGEQEAPDSPSPIPARPLRYACPPSPIQTQLVYWKQQLAGAPPLLDLPTDRTRAALRTFRGATQTFALARELSEALRGMSRREAVTPFMTLLAAFTVLLHRYTGQADIVVGTPIAGRTRVEIEKLIGFFLNTLVLRMDLAGRPSFRELLRRVREVCLGAYAHQDLPFERLLEELQPERDLSHTPLFQVFFNMLNLPNNRVELPGLSLEILAPPDMGAKFDLTLYVEEKDQCFEFNLVYNADLFEPDQMRELLEQLDHLLLQIVEHPQEAIDHFSLVGHTARTRLPDPTAALDLAWQGAVHTALSRQTRRVPGRLAVADPHESWTYAELDARSNQLANYLIEHDIRREEVVAIYAHRSAALVWALIGVLKAGAAFVILDPAYPAARLISYLQIAQPRAWLQIEAAGPLPDLLEEFVAAIPWRCRCVLPGYAAAIARGLLTGYSSDDPGVEVGPDDLACVSFTSGSTGKPKGILGRHGPLTHFMPWQAETFELAESDRFSMLSGIAHDPLQRDIFTPLWLGALICIPDPQDIRVPGRLVAWMQQAEISIAHLTPALGQVLTETTPGMTSELRSLRYAFIVGDVLTRHDVSRIRALAPAVTCVNFYGATETQRAVGYYIIPNDGALDQGQTRLKEILPLGRGMPDAQLLVLNAAQQLAGIGEVGEIYVRSPHLARGYLGDEVLTRERFIANPFAEVLGVGCWVLGVESSNTQHPTPNTRLYRTGDLGRYLPDGTVEFFGRVDQQVKIRGFRVELGEIEAVLGQHPSVREAVVLAREDAPGERRLVAYVVPKIEDRGLKIEDSGSSAPDPLSSILYPLSSKLRGFLKERLPAYMIPAAFVALDALPLTPNGKVDRGALPRPDSRGHDSEATYVAPQTDMERIIAAVWREVLRVEAVGVHDNFFDLGGSSIHIVQLHGKLRAVLDREVPILEMFNYPTVGSLARYISREQHAATPSQENQDRIQKQKAAMKRQRQQRPR